MEKLCKSKLTQHSSLSHIYFIILFNLIITLSFFTVVGYIPTLKGGVDAATRTDPPGWKGRVLSYGQKKKRIRLVNGVMITYEKLRLGNDDLLSRKRCIRFR